LLLHSSYLPLGVPNGLVIHHAQGQSAPTSTTHHHTLARGCKYAAIGETEATVAAREKVQLIAPEWEAIRAAVNGIAYIPSDAPMNVRWDTSMHYTTKAGACCNSETSSQHGVPQLAQQAEHSRKSAATHHTLTTKGTTDMVPT
jgi:hypothetical protein